MSAPAAVASDGVYVSEVDGGSSTTVAVADVDVDAGLLERFRIPLTASPSEPDCEPSDMTNSD